MAARRENRAIDFDALVDFSRSAVATNKGTLLIEGIGGVMVPLDDRHTVLDWMTALNIPVVLVTGSYLGSLSHALTSIDAAAPASSSIKAVVVNETPGLDGADRRHGRDAHPLCRADPGRGAAGACRRPDATSGVRADRRHALTPSLARISR